jgi:hypothetical protein
MQYTIVKLPIFGLFLLLVTFPLPSFAYLDPGTGSIILQGILGAIAIGMATGRMWWYRFKQIFSATKDPLEKVEGEAEFRTEDEKSEH